MIGIGAVELLRLDVIGDVRSAPDRTTGVRIDAENGTAC